MANDESPSSKVPLSGENAQVQKSGFLSGLLSALRQTFDTPFWQVASEANRAQIESIEYGQAVRRIMKKADGFAQDKADIAAISAFESRSGGWGITSSRAYQAYAAEVSMPGKSGEEQANPSAASTVFAPPAPAVSVTAKNGTAGAKTVLAGLRP